MIFPANYLIHGTTLNCASKILKNGFTPQRGAFITQMYGPVEADGEDGEYGIFFSNPNDEDGIWGAANALLEAVARELGLKRRDIFIEDVEKYGAFVVVDPELDQVFKHNEDGGSVSLSGFFTLQEPAAGTETGDYYSFEDQRAVQIITGESLGRMIRSVRRYGDSGSFLFSETQIVSERNRDQFFDI